MNEIFVEEENTVYELDPECLKRKEEQRKREEELKRKNKYVVQNTPKSSGCCMIWVVCLLCLIINQ